MADTTPTRSNALALADERTMMRQGFEFLDEKRILLAAEILRELRVYEEARALSERARGLAAGALAHALERHGLEALQLYPAPAPGPQIPAPLVRSFLGLALAEWTAALAPAGAFPSAVDPSLEAAHCREAFLGLVETAARMAMLSRNLRRLAREYRRTERRANALESVLLPEVSMALHDVEGHLELLEQEDVIRYRQAPAASR